MQKRCLAASVATTCALLAGAGGLVACGGGPGATGGSGTSDTAAVEPVVDPGDGGRYEPSIDPADFVEGIDNPYMPMAPGSLWVYEGLSGGAKETVEVTVTPQRREVMGISTVVVRDTVRVDGEVVEDTHDWFAQDKEGNVWYFGEEVRDFENGELVDTAGSWEAGIDGALPGIVMPARPRPGDAYRQEFHRGEAEDMMEILSVTGTLSVPFGAYEGVLQTEDWNPLEPEVIENKYYAAGVGKLLEEKVEGGDERVELVAFTPGGA